MIKNPGINSCQLWCLQWTRLRTPVQDVHLMKSFIGSDQNVPLQIPLEILRRCTKVYKPTWENTGKLNVIRKTAKENADYKAEQMVTSTNKNYKVLISKKEVVYTSKPKHQERDKNYRIDSVVHMLSNNCQVRTWWYCVTRRLTNS